MTRRTIDKRSVREGNGKGAREADPQRFVGKMRKYIAMRDMFGEKRQRHSTSKTLRRGLDGKISGRLERGIGTDGDTLSVCLPLVQWQGGQSRRIWVGKAADEKVSQVRGGR